MSTIVNVDIVLHVDLARIGLVGKCFGVGRLLWCIYGNVTPPHY